MYPSSVMHYRQNLSTSDRWIFHCDVHHVIGLFTVVFLLDLIMSSCVHQWQLDLRCQHLTVFLVAIYRSNDRKAR
jgi:hypothetical protein